MAYISIERFLGLDTRRAELTSQAGSLAVAENGHINQGGEFEKRKAFVPYPVLPDMYGLEVTSQGLTTFGTKVFIGATPAAGSGYLGIGVYSYRIVYEHPLYGFFYMPNLVASVTTTTGNTKVNIVLPIGPSGTVSRLIFRTKVNGSTFYLVDTVNNVITTYEDSYADGSIGSIFTPVNYASPIFYQRLTGHPNGLEMTKVVASATFGGKAFVIAEFSDGSVFAFYDGVIVEDNATGVIYSSMNTLPKIADAIAAAINIDGTYTATRTNPADAVVTITGDAGVTFDLNFVLTSTAGTITIQKIADPAPIVAAVSARGSFTIVAGTVGAANKITSITVNGQEIINTAIEYLINNSQTALAVCNVINGFQSTPLDYVANFVEGKVTITAVNGGVAANGFVIVVTTEGSICLGNGGFQLNDGVATFEVTSINIAGGANILTASIAKGAGTLAQMAANIVANIVAGASAYTAVAWNDTVLLAKRVTSSSDTDLAISVTYTPGGAPVGVLSTPGTIPPDNDIIAVVSPITDIIRVRNHEVNSEEITCVVTGGTSPYQYLWTWVSGVGLYPQKPTSAATVFITNGTKGQTVYYCQVTDNAGKTMQSNTVSILVA